MLKEKTELEQIKELYAKLWDKTAFMQSLAIKVDRSANTLKNHWFSSWWGIPLKNQHVVLKELKSTIEWQEKQKETV